MQKLMPYSSSCLLDYETGELTEFEGIVVPIQDLTTTSVFWMPNAKDPYIKGCAFEHFVTELGRQIWQSVRETANTAKDGDGAKIWVHWVAEAEVKPLPEELR